MKMGSKRGAVIVPEISLNLLQFRLNLDLAGDSYMGMSMLLDDDITDDHYDLFVNIPINSIVFDGQEVRGDANGILNFVNLATLLRESPNVIPLDNTLVSISGNPIYRFMSSFHTVRIVSGNRTYLINNMQVKLDIELKLKRSD